MFTSTVAGGRIRKPRAAKMTISFRHLLVFAAALAVALPAGADEKRHRRHEKRVGASALVVAAPLLLLGGSSESSAPVVPRTYPGFGPVLYFERADATPSPGTTEWFYCPSSRESWPEARECPEGWARVVEHPGPDAPGD